jgi:hypothetical protein
MNKISNAIKCVNCKHILDTPVSLPCGHSICKKHSTGVKEPVLCYSCGVEHQLPRNGEFPQNLGLTEIIEAQIGSFDFGKEYHEAKQSCEQFDELLTKIEHTLNDPFHFTHDAIEYLKNVVQLKGEQMKHEIDMKMSSSFQKLDEYKNECKSKCKTIEYLQEATRLGQEKDANRKQLNEWLVTLNEFKFNDSVWKMIKNESEKKIESVQNELDRFKASSLLQNRYGKFRVEIEEELGNFEIDPAFRNLE